MSSMQAILKGVYKGFSIYYSPYGQQWSDYYKIFKDGECVTSLALSSVQACKNVIDTYIRNHKEYCINDLPDSVGGGHKQI